MIGDSWHVAFRLAWDGPKGRCQPIGWKRSLTQWLTSKSDFAYISVIFFSEICDPPELKLALIQYAFAETAIRYLEVLGCTNLRHPVFDFRQVLIKGLVRLQPVANEN